MAMHSTRGGLAALALLLAACTPLAEGTQQAGRSFTTAMHDNIDAWSGLFSYTPRDTRPLLPQTRYCYQMQSDIVCYDSPQPNMTAKLIGYQDGTSVSWVQPGGGSLGASGGEPTAPYDAKTVQIAPTVGHVVTPVRTVSTEPPPMVLAGPIPTGPSEEAQAAQDEVATEELPFATGESTYVK